MRKRKRRKRKRRNARRRKRKKLKRLPRRRLLLKQRKPQQSKLRTKPNKQLKMLPRPIHLLKRRKLTRQPSLLQMVLQMRQNQKLLHPNKASCNPLSKKISKIYSESSTRIISIEKNNSQLVEFPSFRCILFSSLTKKKNKRNLLVTPNRNNESTHLHISLACFYMCAILFYFDHLIHRHTFLLLATTTTNKKPNVNCLDIPEYIHTHTHVHKAFI